MLDMRTLMVTYVLNSLMNTLVIFIYWRQNKKYFSGMSYWVIALALQTIGFLLLGVRGALPDFVTIVVSNFLIVTASFLLLEGFKYFVGYQSSKIHNFIILAVYFVLQYYFAFIQPSTSIRIIIISIFTSVFFGQSGSLLLSKKKHSYNAFAKMTGILCFVYILVQAYRAGVELLWPTTDYFSAGLPATAGQVVNQFLTIAMVLSFVIMVNGVNIFNRLKNEKEIIASKAKIEDLYNNAPCGYHSADRNGVIINMNDTELAWLGYSRDEVVGRLKLTDIATPESAQKVRELLPRLIETGSMNDNRVELLTRSGKVLPVITNAKAIYDDKGHFLYSLTNVFDRTEINRVERELISALEKADQANKAKGEFLSKMSHELRTPLNAIIALSGVLQRALTSKIPDDEYGYLEVINRSGNNLLNMINDILDLSRIESGRVELEITAFDLNDILTKIIETTKPLADAKQIDLVYNNFGTTVDVRSDQHKIEHIVQNLVSNAIKFTDKGSVTISLTKTETKAVISVKDTGIGISETNIPLIFDEFRQADSSITRRFGGTGLGLSIVSKYLDLLDGHISVNSIPGQGSEFIVEIQLENESLRSKENVHETPADQTASRPLLAAETEALPSANSRVKKSILVVEDNPDNMLVVRAILHRDFLLHEAMTGERALEMAQSMVPDAILMDINLPGISGMETFRFIRKTPALRHIPVIALSASVMPDEYDSVLREGFDAFVVKPIDSNNLISALQGVLFDD